MPSFLTLTPEVQVASAPASSPRYPLPSLHKDTSSKQPTTSSPENLMLTLLLPAPPKVTTKPEGQRAYIEHILRNMHELRTQKNPTSNTTTPQTIECYNIIIGQTNRDFHTFKAGSYVTVFQILAESVSGLDLPNYASEWERLIQGTIEPICAPYWEMHGGMPRAGSPVAVPDSPGLYCVEKALLMKTVPGMQVLSGEAEGRKAVAEIAQWGVRTEVAVIEDVPFLTVWDAETQSHLDELVRVGRDGWDMRSLKGAVEMFKGENELEARWHGVLRKLWASHRR